MIMKYLKIFVDFSECMQALTDAEKGRLFVAMLNYAATGEIPDLTGAERVLWAVAKQSIDRQAEAYDNICAVNKRNVTKRYESKPIVTNRNETQPIDTKVFESKQDKDNDKDKDKKKNKKVFTPPTVDEVRTYCEERKNSINAERFVDYYTAQDWKLSNGVKMADWRAAVRNWEKRDTERPKKFNRVVNGYEQKDIGSIDHLIIDL